MEVNDKVKVIDLNANGVIAEITINNKQETLYKIKFLEGCYFTAYYKEKELKLISKGE